MGYKNYLESKEGEKRFYQICTDLMNKGESIIDDASDWGSTLRKFGLRGQPLIQSGFLEPIWKTENMNNKNKRLIRVSKGVKVTENKKLKKSIFNFIRI